MVEAADSVFERLDEAEVTDDIEAQLDCIYCALYAVSVDGVITYRLSIQVPPGPVMTMTVFIFEGLEAGCRNADGVSVPAIGSTVVIFEIMPVIGVGNPDPFSSLRPVLTSSLPGIGVPPVKLLKPSAVRLRYRL